MADVVDMTLGRRWVAFAIPAKRHKTKRPKKGEWQPWQSTMQLIVWPLVERLQEEVPYVHNWYTSIRDVGEGTHLLCRFYLEIDAGRLESVKRQIARRTPNAILLGEPAAGYDAGHDFDVLNLASRVSRDLMPKAVKHGVTGKVFLRAFDAAVRKHPSLQNRAGIHWLENQLYTKESMIDRAIRMAYTADA